MKIRDSRKSDWFWAENGIVDREDLGVYEKMGYIALCRHANRANRCYPSIPTVAKKIGCSPRRASQALKILEDKKLIGIRRRLSQIGDPTSNEYTIYSARAGEEDSGVPHDMHHPLQDVREGGESDTARVAQHMHGNNTSVEPTLSSTTSAGVVVSGSEIKQVKKILSAIPYEGISDLLISRLIAEKGFSHVLETANKIVTQWTPEARLIKNPSGHFRALVQNGMDAPPGFVSQAAKEDRKTKEKIRKATKREEMERLRHEDMPLEVRNFIHNFCHKKDEEA